MRKKLLAAAFAGALAFSAAIPALAAHNANSNDNNVAICHNGHTINVSLQGGHHHLLHHATDAAGECDDNG